MVTKDQNVITLDGPDTYHAWFSFISGYIAEDLWTYVNLNSEEAYKIPKEVTFDMARAGATSLRELKAVEKNIYIGLKAIHKTDIQQYQRYLTEIARLRSKILTTIAKEKRAILQADKSVRVWITNLQTSTRPTNV